MFSLEVMSAAEALTIDRFGRHEINVQREAPPVLYGLPFQLPEGALAESKRDCQGYGTMDTRIDACSYAQPFETNDSF